MSCDDCSFPYSLCQCGAQPEVRAVARLTDRLAEATALLERCRRFVKDQPHDFGIGLLNDLDAFTRAPAQAEPTEPDECDRCGTPIDGDKAATSDVCYDCWKSAESAVRELKAQLDAVRNVLRWEPCVVDAEDEDGPVYQCFLTDDAGPWVRWEELRALLSPQAPGTEEPTNA